MLAVNATTVTQSTTGDSLEEFASEFQEFEFHVFDGEVEEDAAVEDDDYGVETG